LDNLTGSARLVVNVADKNGSFRGKVILDSLEYLPAKVQVGALQKILSRNIDNTSENEDITHIKETDIFKKSVRKKYTLSDTIMIDEVTIIGRQKETPLRIHINRSRMHYGQPDKEVIMTPQLESVKEFRDILMGSVAGLTFSKPVGGGSGIRIHGMTTFSDGQEPLFLLDGMISSYSEINYLPKNWIDRIDVIKSERAAAFGVRGAFGVISVITKTANDITYNPVSFSVNTDISGYDAPRVFYSPTHISKFQSGQLPDLRSTLYWFPDIKVVTNQDYLIKFYNADVSSTYKIIVEGITSGGIPVTGKVEYEVK